MNRFESDKTFDDNLHIERIDMGTPEELFKDTEHSAQDGEYSDREQTWIIRKVDLRLIIPLGLMLGASFLDRTNIGNAAIAGYSLILFALALCFSNPKLTRPPLAEA